jgi:hypothetical protein
LSGAGANYGYAIWSADGCEWTDLVLKGGLVTTTAVNGVAYGKGRFVAVGMELGEGSKTLMYSNEQE